MAKYKKFKTLAEFKRIVKPGDMIHTIYHKEPAGRSEDGKFPVYKDKDLGIAEITEVRHRQMGIKRTKKDGSSYISWIDFPKKADHKIIGLIALEIYECNDKILTYKLPENENT